MKILKFIISIVLTVSIISPNINFAFAEDSNVVFDGEFYKITEIDNDYQVLDKENNKTVDLIAENGKISKIKFDDGTVVTPSQQNTTTPVKRIGYLFQKVLIHQDLLIIILIQFIVTLTRFLIINLFGLQ